MTVTPQHLLTGTVRIPVGDLFDGGRPMPVRRCAVIHYTEGGAGRTSIGWWQQAQNRRLDLGAHLLIERDGTVIQCRAFNRTISHAGTSRWQDPGTRHLYRGLNACSIGIELANTGSACDTIKGEEQLRGYAGTVIATHRNGGPKKKWEAFGEEQILSLIAVCQALVERYHLDDITGHDCIAPERKVDPGPAFPMARVRAACGFSGLPAVHWP